MEIFFRFERIWGDSVIDALKSCTMLQEDEGGQKPMW